jgi:hypothetical protein
VPPSSTFFRPCLSWAALGGAAENSANARNELRGSEVGGRSRKVRIAGRAHRTYVVVDRVRVADTRANAHARGRHFASTGRTPCPRRTSCRRSAQLISHLSSACLGVVRAPESLVRRRP